MKHGKLFVFSGPSASGKGTICRELLKEPDTWLSVSLTTRQPREGELHGVHYYFVTREEYDRTVEEDGFLEHAEIYGNCYGTPKKYALEHMAAGEDVILEIEIRGAKQILKKCPDALSIYIVPPSIEELERRLRERSTEDEETIMKRVAKAKREMKDTDLYEHVVCNDNLDTAIEEVRQIILKEINK